MRQQKTKRTFSFPCGQGQLGKICTFPVGLESTRQGGCSLGWLPSHSAREGCFPVGTGPRILSLWGRPLTEGSPYRIAYPGSCPNDLLSCYRPSKESLQKIDCDKTPVLVTNEGLLQPDVAEETTPYPASSSPCN